jgi:hypothetical protein
MALDFGFQYPTQSLTREIANNTMLDHNPECNLQDGEGNDTSRGRLGDGRWCIDNKILHIEK